MIAGKIDIILPNRIGDLILTLPAILCLKQLKERYASDRREIRLVSPLALNNVISALNLFEVIRIDTRAKIRSWLSPADKAFFLCTSSKNIGYHAKVTLGRQLSNKKLIRYSVDLRYLSEDPDTCHPQDLVYSLRHKFQLPNHAIKQFGICLELGYTVEQILQTFRYDVTHLSFPDEFYDWQPPIETRYLVFCMEAAYGRNKHNSDRRWKEEHFFELAERAHQIHNVASVFIGISDVPALPDRNYFIDLRQKLDLDQIAKLQYFSCGYVGNDTGPLHLANLMKKRSIGMYFREEAVRDYPPIFPHLNKILFKPKGPEEIFQPLDELLRSQ
jgi:ADP-heptose:LPS heptosyltransferase